MNFPKSGNWGCTVLTDEDPLENWACSQRWQESAFGPRLFVNASCRNPNPKSVCFSSVWRLWVFFSPLHLIMSHKPGYGPQVAVAWMALLNLSSSICFLREKMITDAAPSPSLSHCSSPSSDPLSASIKFNQLHPKWSSRWFVCLTAGCFIKKRE